MRAEVRVVAILIGLLLGVAEVPALAHEEEVTDQGAATGPEECFAVADWRTEEADREGEDLLTRVDRNDPGPDTNETDVGDGTGTHAIEAIALQPGTGALFAADAGLLGTLDVDTGRFVELGPVGAGAGDLGRVELDDIDGLTFDPATGFLYGTQRRWEEEDLLLRLDPVTGAVVEGAIGGADYAAVSAVEGLLDIDDIAIDPGDGQMYAVANDDGRDDRLVRIDKATGATTDIGPMAAEDVEGLGFAAGQLIGTTGKADGREGIWDIDKESGEATNHRPLDNGRDYEAFDCLNPPAPVAAPLSCLVVTQDAVPDDPVSFPFLLTGADPSEEILPAEVTLDDDPASDTPATVEYCELPAGAYTVTQTTPPNWPLTELVCSDPSGGTAVDADAARAEVALDDGETVTCAYTNRPAPVRDSQEVEGGEVTAPREAEREAAEAPLPVAVAPDAALPQPEALAELPRTGRDGGRHLIVGSGIGLALGGLALVGGTRRPVRRGRGRV